MMSVAGGWFFLMACEMFVLGKRDFRLRDSVLPANRGEPRRYARDSGGVAAMIAVIVILDQLVWRPIIAWADKFKFEQVESSALRRPLCLILSAALPLCCACTGFLFNCFQLAHSDLHAWRTPRRRNVFRPKQSLVRRWIGYLLATGILVGLGLLFSTRRANYPVFIAKTIENSWKALRLLFCA